MAVKIIEVTDNKQFKDFVDVQFEIYKNNNFWVPPIKKDEVKAIQSAYNPAFRFCKAKFWVAYKDAKCVGRIGAIINEQYNEKTGEKAGRFTRLEFFDNEEVVKNGVNGYVLPVQDPKAWSELLMKLFSGEEKITANTSDLIATEFSIERMVANYVALIIEK